MSRQLPDPVFIGRTDGQWPLFAFESEAMALEWLRDDPATQQRRVWAFTGGGTELEGVFPPTPRPFLREIGGVS